MKGSVGGERLKYPISLSNLLLVIQIRPLRLARRTKIPVKDASLPLDPGWTIGLTGGSGKASPFALRCGESHQGSGDLETRHALVLARRECQVGMAIVSHRRDRLTRERAARSEAAPSCCRICSSLGQGLQRRSTKRRFGGSGCTNCWRPRLANESGTVVGNRRPSIAKTNQRYSNNQLDSLVGAF
ncbi:MAG: hypothetical protein KDG53_00550 [Rhodocyclaceae bacterium]|nr:hypothetical protein [Rhodocyclaceae bacterium]MCB1959218.1 hypothetical protein [Rhodocyclaceae bacterium]